MATKTQIAKLTKLIFDKLSTTEYHPIDWRTAIYTWSETQKNHQLLYSYKYRDLQY